jgi:hypothetical protein
VVALALIPVKPDLIVVTMKDSLAFSLGAVVVDLVEMVVRI